MTPTEFTPFASLIGGGMIGAAAVLLMASHGRIAGISGITAALLPPFFDAQWKGRLAFVAGLVVAPLVYAAVSGQWPPMTIATSHTALVLAGVLVGFGSVWGSGCTSGHGICGLSRFSARSLVAVLTFMATAMLTVAFTRHLM
jgi:uncharacterized protein